MVLRPFSMVSGDEMNGDVAYKGIGCGKEAAPEFGFADEYRNLNHGSFGTYPLSIRAVLRQYQDEAEAKPDVFIRYEYREALDRSREAMAHYLNAPVSTCVFVPNATTAMNIVLRNIVYEPGDVIIMCPTIYGACEKTVEYITETTPAESYKIEYTYPVSDDELCRNFEQAVSAIRDEGKKPKLAIFDTIVSMPGLRMPFERLTKLCKQYEILSCIDGAHGIGHIPLDLSALDPDFFFSNCHKWLYVPRGCAAFYVPERNQHLMRSTLPTSHGFVPLPAEGKIINNPLPPSAKSEFVTNFEFVGTIDNAPYLCIPTALEWRSNMTWKDKRGEEAIMSYCLSLAREAGKTVSNLLGTDVMENTEGTLGICNFSNVRLPLSYAEVAGGDHATAVRVAQWIAKVQVEEYNTFIAVFFYADSWFVRLSSQVYLTIEDFEWAGGVLKEICERVRRGDWKQ